MDTAGPEAALRDALVDRLKAVGHVWSPGVEAAMRAVSRHHFAPWLTLERAYEDSAFPILGSSEAAPATISQPAAVAIMLEGFSLARGQRVLEIGAGTGYNAALMAHVVGEEGRVVTVDIEGWLVEAARERLESSGFGEVTVVHGDGGLGFGEVAPYDRIVATVGAWDIPPAWRDQLAEGGRIVVPSTSAASPTSTCSPASSARATTSAADSSPRSAWS